MRLAARLGEKEFGGYECRSCLVGIKKNAEDKLIVKFTMKGSEQEGGFLEINQSTARWLANALLSATNIEATKVEISAILSEKN